MCVRITNLRVINLYKPVSNPLNHLMEIEDDEDSILEYRNIEITSILNDIIQKVITLSKNNEKTVIYKTDQIIVCKKYSIYFSV